MLTTEDNSPTDVLKLFEEKKLVKICAPMVRYSKLQFRNLVREYGCDLCFTPMILADSFCRSAKARSNEFTTNFSDFPLIVQFAANTVHDFVGAAHMVSPYSSGVDLNCGCPQRWAKQMGIGCAMLDHPELISDLVLQCRNRISKPFTISIKLRILKDIRKTVEICRRLEKAGVSFISVHARTPSQHTGDIDVQALKLVAENVHCPVIGNGGIKNLSNCFKLQEDTKCNGVMVANGLLTNPTLFTGTEITTKECVQKWLDICYNSTLDGSSYNTVCHMVNESFNLVIPERPPNLTFQCFHHHLVFMLEKFLPRSKRKIFNNLQNFHDVLLFLYEHLGVAPQLYAAETFESSRVLSLNYDERDEVYNELKLDSKESSMFERSRCEEYSYENNQGKYFNSKVSNEMTVVEYDLANIFI